MADQPEPMLRIHPFVLGAAAGGRTIIRCADAARYLDVTKSELDALTALAERPVTTGEFLARHLGAGGAPDGLDLRAAVALIMRLHQAGFIRDTSSEIVDRLREYSAALPAHVTGRLVQAVTVAGELLDLQVLRFPAISVHSLLKAAGRLLVRPVTLALMALTVAFTFFYEGLTGASLESVVAMLERPEAAILMGLLGVSTAASLTAVAQLAALAGSGAGFVGAGLNFTAFCVLRLRIDDIDSLMLPRGARWRYAASTLLVPWFMAALAWRFSDFGVMGASQVQIAATFALIGVIGLCPILRGPLIRTLEGHTATLNLLDRVQAYLTTGLFSPLTRQGRQSAGPRGGDAATLPAVVPALAASAMLWLYGVTLLGADALIGAVPQLWAVATETVSLRAAAAWVVLLALGMAGLAPAVRLVLIPFQNLAAMAAVPLTRARRGLSTFRGAGMPDQAAVAGFLQEVPLFANLAPAVLPQLAAAFSSRTAATGQNLVVRGERGDEFFLLAEGRAQVLGGGDGLPFEVLEVLGPGDSFGEIALIDNVRRTATVRALSPCRLLVLSRPAFDRIFPAGSPERTHLTTVIRNVKLVLESQALSHLTPRQIRELLVTARPVEFPAGAWLVREDDEADAAWLIEAGEVQVVREGQGREVATLARGQLVGAIALIHERRRSASVRALTDVRALRIDRESFLKICVSNLFVAHLIADLSAKQLAELQAG